MTLTKARSMAGKSTWATYSREDVDAALALVIAELTRLEGQTCATCRHSYTPLSAMLACGLTKDDAGDGLPCETFGHRCGAWARREP
jgi:hypothetical protein